MDKSTGKITRQIMSKPTLALCIPAYNAADYLPRLLSSAQKQEIPFDEILVYDDCSTDHSAKIAARYGATVLRGTMRIGCSAGRNSLAAHCRTDWIHFHDADDALLPNFTTLAHRWIALPDPPDIVLFDYEWRDNDSGALLAIRRFNKTALENDPLLYAIHEQINPFCGLYRKRAFLNAGGYDTDPNVRFNEDVAFHCKMAAAGLSFSSESAVAIINYRVSGSMSNQNPIQCIRAHYEVLRKNACALPPRYHPALAAKLWACAGAAGSYLDWPTTDKAASLALSLHPPVRHHGNPVFAFLCHFYPPAAFRLREYLIRWSKTQARR